MQFPKQNISESKKDEDWYNSCVDAILKEHKDNAAYIAERKKDHENYLLVQGQFNTKNFEYVTNMYGPDSPARLVNYPMILPKLNLLAGDIISQELKWSVNVVNPDAVRRKNEKLVQIAAETILRPHRRKIEKVIGMEIPDENLGEEVPEDVASFKKLKFRDTQEKYVHIGLTYLNQSQRLGKLFERGFYDIGITGKEFYHVYVKNRDPYIERVDPRSMIWDFDSDKEFLHDCRYAGKDNYYTISEIIDTLFLDKEEVEELEKLEEEVSNNYTDYNTNYDAYYKDANGLKIRLVHLEWKTIRYINYKVSPNKYDPEMDFYKMVPDNYEAKPGEKIVSKAINDVCYAIRIGHKKLYRYGFKPNVIRHEDNYAKCNLGFFGVIKGAFTNTTVSVVDALKNIQLLLNIVMYHIELAMARSGGKALVYDTSQMPKGMNMKDVTYHAKNSGLIPINSKQEGGQINTFNQFSQVDFTLSNAVSQLVNIKVMLENTADQLTGITASRAGITKSSDAVGVNERSVMQSTLITAPLFNAHYELVGQVLNEAANLMRYCWADEGRMVNIFGDMSIQAIKIPKSIALDEYGIFVENSSKELQRVNTMRSMMDRLASTGQIDAVTAMKAINAESSVDVEQIVNDGMEALQKMQAQAQEQQAQAEQMKQQNEAQKMQQEFEIAKMKVDADIRMKQMEIESKYDLDERNKNFEKDKMDVEKKNEMDKMAAQKALQPEEPKPEMQEQEFAAGPNTPPMQNIQK